MMYRKTYLLRFFSGKKKKSECVGENSLATWDKGWYRRRFPSEQQQMAHDCLFYWDKINIKWSTWILYVQLDRFWQLCTPMKRDTEQNKEYLHLQEFCMPLLINSVLHTLSVLPLQISSAYIWVWYKGMYTICILFLVPTCFHLMHLFLDLSMLLCSFYYWVVFYCVKCLVTHLFIFLLRNSRTLFSSLGKL